DVREDLLEHHQLAEPRVPSLEGEEDLRHPSGGELAQHLVLAELSARVAVRSQRQGLRRHSGARGYIGVAKSLTPHTGRGKGTGCTGPGGTCRRRGTGTPGDSRGRTPWARRSPRRPSRPDSPCRWCTGPGWP